MISGLYIIFQAVEGNGAVQTVVSGSTEVLRYDLVGLLGCGSTGTTF